MEALRRRVEELELENALMREVVEVVKKDPGADLRRLSNREKTMLIDRLRPRYSLRSMACLLRIAPSSYHYHHARIGVDKYAGLRARVARAFADSKGRYGYRRVKAALGTGVSEKVIRRLMAEGVFCQVGVGRFGVSFSPCERRVSGRFGVGRSCWLLVIALVIA